MCFLTLLGSVVPEKWKGTLGITYHLGPEFNRGEVEVELNVSNNLEEVPIYNVIGTIYGKEEPDRYVLIGNHRDAWVHGAIDASTGTSVTAEIGRVLGELLKTGWRPRRTIKVRQLETYSHGVIFNRISKVIRNYLSFALHRSVIGVENLHHSLNQSDAKVTSIMFPIVTRSPAFSRAFDEFQILT